MALALEDLKIPHWKGEITTVQGYGSPQGGILILTMALVLEDLKVPLWKGLTYGIPQGGFQVLITMDSTLEDLKLPHWKAKTMITQGYVIPQGGFLVLTTTLASGETRAHS